MKANGQSGIELIVKSRVIVGNYNSIDSIDRIQFGNFLNSFEPGNGN